MTYRALQRETNQRPPWWVIQWWQVLVYGFICGVILGGWVTYCFFKEVFG